MAIVGLFKNAIKNDVDNTEVIIYEAPLGLDSIMIELDIASVTGAGVQVDVFVEDVSEATTVHLVKNAPVPEGAALKVIDGQKIVLESGDRIKVKTNGSGHVVDVVASIIEDVNTIL